jgi:type IV secretion system protein VirB2
MKSVFSSDKLWSLCLCFVMAYAVFLLPSSALASSFGGSVTVGFGSGGGGGGGTIGAVLCNVANWFKGPIGRGIATLAIIVIGVGALMGKVSWGMAIIVGIGIAVIFGAPTIVNELGAGGGGC